MRIQIFGCSVVLTAVILFTGCASAGSSVGSERDGSGTIEIHDPSLGLADCIRRSGGVSVHDIDGKTIVRIRGNLFF